MSTEKLLLTGITVDPEIQIRETLDRAKVQEYAEVLDQLPPVTVFRDEEGRYWLADGFHRYEAAKLAGRTEIEVNVVAGPRREALLHAALANARHGIPLTRAEKVKAIERLLAIQPDWSDRRIASSLGVSPSSVAKYRQEIVPAEDSTVQIGQLPIEQSVQTEQLPIRKGADGKVRRLPVRRKAAPVERGETCPHGLAPEHCAYCQGWEPETGETEEIEPPRQIPVNGNGKTTHITVEEPAQIVRDQVRQIVRKTAPVSGACTAAAMHCPHCGDRRGREICNACGRERWVITFKDFESYQKALAMLAGLLR